jgi:hypothetical protein
MIYSDGFDECSCHKSDMTIDSESVKSLLNYLYNFTDDCADHMIANCSVIKTFIRIDRSFEFLNYLGGPASLLSEFDRKTLITQLKPLFEIDEEKD